ncbi:MAG: zinc ribbon domain-containing protein, partial [Coriobacteriia bacterium]|nr:zinc ribbon domain-containing protein [Coriobacteriia bacterium]
MICPHCGRYLEDGVAFCIYCGQRLGKYADETAEASQTVNLSDNPDAQGAVASAAGSHQAAAGAAAVGAAGAAAAAAPVAPASAQEAAHAAASTRGTGSRPSVSGRGTRNTGRLHSDDEIAKRMNELDDAPSAKRGRKVVAGVLLAALTAGAIGVGANYVVPSILDNGGSSSSSSQATSSSSDSSSATKSTSSKSDSKSAKSTKST